MSNKVNSNKPKNVAKKEIFYTEQEEKYSSYFLIPLFIILCMIPFIVRLKEYNPNLSQFQWFSNDDVAEDMFLYYKHWIFVAVAAGMALIIGVKAFLDRRIMKFSPVFIPLAIYAILALVSSVFSKYASFCFSGSYEQFESVFALLGYCIVVYYVFLFAKTEKNVKLIITFVLIEAIVMVLLGIAQFTGHDFFGTTLGNDLILPAKYQGYETSLVMGVGRIYLSLYNPNYVGVYTALITPIFLIMLFFQKSKKNIILYTCIVLGLVLCTFGSQSLAGILGIIVAVICTIIFMWRYLLKHYYITIPVVLVAIIGLIAMNIITDNLLWNKLMYSIGNSRTSYALTQMDTNDDNVSLTYNGNKLYVQYIANGDQSVNLIPTDETGQMVAGTYDEATKSYLLTDERFSGISLGLSEQSSQIFYIQESGVQWFFTNQLEGGGTYYHVNRVGKLDKMVTAPSAVFTGYENFASMRGYIWSRTIPTLRNYLFLGSGPDTFVMAFPQQDYLNMSKCGFAVGLLTKPHCLYLQMGVQTGVLSLIAFLIFYGMYFISSFLLYIKGRFNSYYAQIGVAIFIGTIGYMVTGLTNDSSINTAPIFWTLIGVGIVVNHKAKQLILKEAALIKDNNVIEKKTAER